MKTILLYVRIFQIYFIFYLLILIINAQQQQKFNDQNVKSLQKKHLLNNDGNTYLNYNIKTAFVNNLTVLMGETVYLNCTFNLKQASNRFNDEDNSINIPNVNPTWLKAEAKYDQSGQMAGFKAENIIVTRKGVIANDYKGKFKLKTVNNDKMQILSIVDVNAKDEGKYICREFNSQNDKIFYLKVYASVNGLSMKLNSESKHFRLTSNSYLNRISASENIAANLASTASLREDDELIINCTVNSSKPAAEITILLTPSVANIHDDESKKLDIVDFYSTRNKDYTMKSVAVARYKVNRYDNQKSISCIAENIPLDEKWETKRSLNVLYPPQCNPNQKLSYHTGINQTIELECRMTDANPPNLEFSWNFINNHGTRDKIRTNGYLSKINWTPRSEADFGEVSCVASNTLDVGECRIKLELGGTPNPPENCYYKENNTTVIIECSPGFHQGDPEIYFYLLKKKSNGVLIEYARKRDSCSFLISKSILEEYLNEFFIYSSNKYGNNKELAVKLIIHNEDILIKSANKDNNLMNRDTKTIMIIIACVCSAVIFLGLCCCICIKCSKSHNHHKNHLGYDDYRQKASLDNYDDRTNNSSPIDNQILENEKLYSSIRIKDKTPSLKKNPTSTFLLKEDIQVLDMSPTTKKKLSENDTNERDRYRNGIVDSRDDIYYFDKTNRNANANEDSNYELNFSNYYTYNSIDSKAKKKENIWYKNHDSDENNYEEFTSKPFKVTKKQKDHANNVNNENSFKRDINTGSSDLVKNTKFGILV